MAKNNLIKEIKNKASQYKGEVLEIRRHLHQNPELSFNEFNTSAYIQKKLTELNIEFTASIVKPGVVALIKRKNSSKKTIALRADMDALPIQEENNISAGHVDLSDADGDAEGNHSQKQEKLQDRKCRCPSICSRAEDTVRDADTFLFREADVPQAEYRSRDVREPGSPK